MSDNQLHGKRYEDYMKVAFQGASDHERSALSSWDIEAAYDFGGLPTSIKTTGSNTIELADARKFWSISIPYRLLVAKYKQNNNMKSFYELHEFLISLEEHKKLLGSISLGEIKDFHETLLSFSQGEHKEARVFSKTKKMELKSKSIIQLNPKIDSKTQRRLQCSVKIDTLTKNINNSVIYGKDDFYRDIPIHISFKSGPREFSK